MLKYLLSYVVPSSVPDSLSTYQAMVYRARTPSGGAPDQRQRAAALF